jgi:hypothetical protein
MFSEHVVLRYFAYLGHQGLLSILLSGLELCLRLLAFHDLALHGVAAEECFDVLDDGIARQREQVDGVDGLRAFLPGEWKVCTMLNSDTGPEILPDSSVRRRGVKNFWSLVAPSRYEEEGIAFSK